MNDASPGWRRGPDTEEIALLAKERQFCSYGDTVHYAERPKIFERCEGSYLYDLAGRKVAFLTPA